MHATSFWIEVLGFLKALVWPAMLVFKLLEFLKMQAHINFKYKNYCWQLLFPAIIFIYFTK
jgi:hypothetical protein